MSIETATLEQSLIAKTPVTGELGTAQQQAASHFLAAGLPQRKSESYKYTPVADILRKNLDFSERNPSSLWSVQEIESAFYDEKEANHLVFLNGEFQPKNSVIKSSPEDLTIEVLDEENVSKKEIQNLLGKIAYETDVFATLNLSQFTEGLLLTSQKGKSNLSTFIYHFADSEAKVMVHPRILILGEAQSSLHVFEKTFTRGKRNVFINSLVEVSVAENAEVRLTKLQNYTSTVFAVEGVYAHQHRDSRFYTNTYTFKAGMIRNNLAISVDAENCEAHMHGLYLVNGKTHVDNNTTVDHRKPHSYSNELYKGIIDEQARAVFNGKIYVRPDAQKTNAFQANNNIMLSDTASIHTKPQLEIWADDVKCSHGCTTGQLDEEAIFYLRSRGIEKQKAKALMLNAFATDTLAEVTNDLVKKEIETLILNKLG